MLSEWMAGAAEAFGVDPDGDSWDLGCWAESRSPPDDPLWSTPVSEPRAVTHSLLGRNFDFPTGTYSEIVGLPSNARRTPLAADVWVAQLHPDDGYATIVVGIMDVMGGMEGVNEVSLAVTRLADNESPAPEPSVVPQGLSEQQVVRYLIEPAATWTRPSRRC
jgi:hypothetical protein